MLSSRFFDRIASMFFLGILLMYPLLAFAATFSDSTCAAGQFGSGTDSDTQCSFDQVELDATGKTNGSGNFTSRVMDAGSSVTWSSLGWSPSHPYQKNLPSSGGAESAYNGGNIDMTNNIALWHMDEALWNGTNNEVVDSSGGGNHGVAQGDASTISGGKLNYGGTFDGDGDYIDVGTMGTLLADLDSGTSFSLWLKWNHANAWSAILGGSNNGNTQRFDIFINRNGGANTDAGEVAFYINHDQTISLGGGTGNGGAVDIDINDGQWHHVVFTFASLSTGGVTVYVDGQERDISFWQSGSGNTSGSFEGFALGARYTGDTDTFVNPSEVQMDEVSFFDSVLTASEVLAMYKRGALRLQYQVRSCDDGACSGESFIGPDGTGSTYYSELTSAENGLPSKTLSNVLDNRYFQYKAYFETSSTTLTPELLDVTVTYSGGGGSVPEFSDAVYVVTMLFSVFYLSRHIYKRQDAL